MDHAKTNQRQAHPDLERLLKPGVIGHYEWFEVIEVGFSSGSIFRNLLSLYVAVEGSPPRKRLKQIFINESDRNVPGIKNLSFGVSRRYITAKELIGAVGRFDQSGIFVTAENPITFGQLRATAPAFYAPDGSQNVPLNCVLKNNFWNGSHVIELADSDKTDLQFLLSDPKAIAAIATWIRKFIAIDISSVTDRLGNAIIQLPVTSIAAELTGSHDNTIAIQLSWHPAVRERDLIGSVVLSFDEAIVSYGQKSLKAGSTVIVSDTSNRPFRGFVWDTDNEVLLAAYPPTIFLGGSVGGSMSTIGSHNRIFYESDGEGNRVRKAIPLRSIEHVWSSGPRQLRPNGTWTERRISDTEIRGLIKQKRFVQYGGSVRGEEEHQRALSDIRELVNSHGEDAVYLWDPYLSTSDVLSTLFHCQHVGSELRALTSAKASGRREPKASCEAPEANPSEASVEQADVVARDLWIQAQRDFLTSSIEGTPHIEFEFRMSFGPQGWPFHDRFLIFPKRKGDPQVWSLGASVNHLGATHAIVQQVAHPQPVIDAFEDLWALVDSEEHLIWKSQ